MAMSYEDWKAQNISAGGRGLRNVYDNWQSGIPGNQPAVNQPAPPGTRVASTTDRGRSGGGDPVAPAAAPAQGGDFSGLSYEQFAQHPDNVGKAPGRLQSEYDAYKVRNTAGYGGRGMGDVGGEQLYTGGQDATGARAWAQQHGMSEDFQRFDEATLQSWEQYRQPNPPDPRRPYLVDGQWVEKPIDSRSFGQGTGVHGPAGRGGGGGQRNVPGIGTNVPNTGTPGLYDPSNPLQNQLIQRAQQGGGYFGEMGDQQGQGPLSYALAGQGVWTSDPDQGADPLASAPASTAISQASQPGGSPALSNQPVNKQAAMQGMGNTPQWSPLAQSGGTGAFAQAPAVAGPTQSPLMGGLMGGNTKWTQLNKR